MSTHRVEVVRLGEITEHPNADRLEIVHIFGYSCVVAKGQWQGGQLGAYVPPDSLVPTDRPEFAFLAEKAKDGMARIRVAKLRGIISQGLLVPAPPGAHEGDDVMEALGVRPYEPPAPAMAGGEAEPPPPGLWTPTYDLENWHRYKHLFGEGEPVQLTEKLHGCSWRAVFHDGRLWSGSRGQWIRPESETPYWRVIRQNPEIETWLRAHPGLVLYGEIYGWVQSLRYGAKPGQVSYAVFDILEGNRWLPPVEARGDVGQGLRWVPFVGAGPYDEATVLQASSGNSLAAVGAGATNIREGIVIEPLEPRTDPEIGRVKLKLVSDQYLLKGE